MLSCLNLKCSVDWKWCDRKLSRPIWNNMWIRTDDIIWCHDLIWGALWTAADCEIMLSWLNLKCYVDWKGCDRKLSRLIWRNLRNNTDDIGWCHDLIWGDMWIWTDDIWCCLNQIYILLCVLERMWQEFSRQVWSSMWVRTSDTGWCLDLIWGALWIGTVAKKFCRDENWSAMWMGKYVTRRFHDKFELQYRLEQMIEDDVMT
jgi:hypothetical protein